ncbi:MAG: NAD(+) synthase [Patescibacteria group bacterium]|nr:NAD(+) synthase [Patescibacteria group bacterium]
MNGNEVGKIYVLSAEQMPFYEQFKNIATRNSDLIFDQAMKFFDALYKGTEIKRAIIGLSGGIDSALVAFFAVKYFGAGNVFVVKMPNNRISSMESVVYADFIIKQFEIPDENVFEISIEKAVLATIESLEKAGVKLDAVDRGNVMARERMKILYAIARVFGGRVLDTCNLTEVLIGYFTIGGDGQSDLNPMGGLYKTWVWELSRIFGLPQEIIDIAPSAGLEAGQTDEEDFGISYPALDLLLYLKYAKKVTDLFLENEYFFSKEIIEMVAKQVRASGYKSVPTPVLRLYLD